MMRTATSAGTRWSIVLLLIAFQVQQLLIDSNAWTQKHPDRHQKYHVVQAFGIINRRTTITTTSPNQRNHCQYQHSTPRMITVNMFLSGFQAHPHNGSQSWKSSSRRRKKSKRERNHPVGARRRKSSLQQTRQQQRQQPATKVVLNSMMILSDKKRQSHFKNAMNEEFPWIPPAMLDVCLSVLSESFASVAPKDLKVALQPGNFDVKVRPKIEQNVVTSLQEQSMIQSLPLSTNDKDKLLKYLVSMSLDFVLQDAKEALAAPSTKLQMLEREKKEVIKFMSLPQIVWYRLRYFPIQSLSFTIFVGWTSYVTWRLYGNMILSYKPPSVRHVWVWVDAVSSFVIDIISKLATTIKAIVTQSWSQIFSSLSIVTSSPIFKTPQKKRFW